MLLSARILTNVASVNVFNYTESAEFTEGDTQDVYFQLIDSSLDKASEGFKPGGRRFMPAAGATLEVTVSVIDSSRTIVRSATQPFPLDPSIWKLSILATDKFHGAIDLRLKLTEGVKLTYGVVRRALAVDSATPARN